MAEKEVAIKKRAQIDKATQNMLVAVGFASVVLGCAAVLSVYFVKWIIFNTKVISAKDEVIGNFKTIQENVKQLTSNIEKLSENENLEVVARTRENRCANLAEGGGANMNGNLEVARICSALRVIPDALPSVQNNEAVYASLNKLFLETRDGAGNPVEPESISPGGSNVPGLVLEPGMGAIPVSLLIKNTAITTRAVLDTIERSVRNYDIQTVRIAWGSSDRENPTQDLLEMRGIATAYYMDALEAIMKTKRVYADDKLNTSASQGSGATR
jgi:hypothetical protein